ncbi:hypothetical protein GDH17_16955 [Salmonella enterica subsp. enterica]|nr:hypothetical protein [Salmonella enterica subsp. enterica serovar Goldcoast]
MVQGNDACGKYVYSKAYCPAGKQLISGGFVLSNWTGGNGWNAPDASMPSPSDNGWQIVTGGGVTGGNMYARNCVVRQKLTMLKLWELYLQTSHGSC